MVAVNGISASQFHTIKRITNLAANGSAGVLNLFTFGNYVSDSFHIVDWDEDLIKTITNIVTKIATAVQGLILCIDASIKKQIIPAVGFFLEMPIAAFTKDNHNLWLFRGISQGLGQFKSAIDRKAVVKNGEEQFIEQILEENGEKKTYKKKLYVTDFLDPKDPDALGKIFKTTVKECGYITKDIFTKPSTLKNMSHGLFLTSVLQITGGLLGLLGFSVAGPILRNTAGISVDAAFMTDRKATEEFQEVGKEPEKKFIDPTSIFTITGLVWITAAIADEAKRIPFIDELFKNLTNLSLASDRLASLVYTEGNLRIKPGHKEEDLVNKDDYHRNFELAKEEYFTAA